MGDNSKFCGLLRKAKLYWTCNSMNKLLLSYCGLVDVGISASDKYLPLQYNLLVKQWYYSLMGPALSSQSLLKDYWAIKIINQFKDDSDYLAFKETTWLYRKFLYHSTFLCEPVRRALSPFKFAVWQ